MALLCFIILYFVTCPKQVFWRGSHWNFLNTWVDWYLDSGAADLMLHIKNSGPQASLDAKKQYCNQSVHQNTVFSPQDWLLSGSVGHCSLNWTAQQSSKKSIPHRIGSFASSFGPSCLRELPKRAPAELPLRCLLLLFFCFFFLGIFQFGSMGTAPPPPPPIKDVQKILALNTLLVFRHTHTLFSSGILIFFPYLIDPNLKIRRKKCTPLHDCNLIYHFAVSVNLAGMLSHFR